MWTSPLTEQGPSELSPHSSWLIKILLVTYVSHLKADNSLPPPHFNLWHVCINCCRGSGRDVWHKLNRVFSSPKCSVSLGGEASLEVLYSSQDKMIDKCQGGFVKATRLPPPPPVPCQYASFRHPPGRGRLRRGAEGRSRPPSAELQEGKWLTLVCREEAAGNCPALCTYVRA